MKEFTVQNRVEFDHQPLVVELEEEISRMREEESEDIREVIEWNKRTTNEYKEKTERVIVTEETVKGMWKELCVAVELAITRKKTRVKKKEIGWKSCHDRERKTEKKKS